MNKIRQIRLAQGLTMKQLGEAIGCTEAAVSFYERGLRQPDNDTLIRIATTLGVSVDALLGRETKEPKKQSPDDALRFALWGGDAQDITPAQLEEVRRFAQFVRERDKHDGK